MNAPWLIDDGGAPWALDAYSGQGGTTKGLQLAGFRVVAVDVVDHSARNPAEVFVVADAPEFIAEHGGSFSVRVAGPPCQGYSIATSGNLAARAKYPRHIALVRELFSESDRPWVIENVEQARSQMVDPVLLCGRMFGLRADDADGTPLVLDRHRLFESNVRLTAPAHPAHGLEQVAGVYGGSRRAPLRPGISHAEAAPFDRFAARHLRHGGYVPRSVAVQQSLLGIDWMTVRGMQESIPPVYAEHIGRQLINHIREAAA
jgi:DNA (cytosine-5)-methyltransferase 1